MACAKYLHLVGYSQSAILRAVKMIAPYIKSSNDELSDSSNQTSPKSNRGDKRVPIDIRDSIADGIHRFDLDFVA